VKVAKKDRKIALLSLFQGWRGEQTEKNRKIAKKTENSTIKPLLGGRETAEKVPKNITIKPHLLYICNMYESA